MAYKRDCPLNFHGIVYELRILTPALRRFASCRRNTKLQRAQEFARIAVHDRHIIGTHTIYV